ncbi:hypothetical protein ACLKMY_16530 [Paraburkholderia mimosarum]|uniref:hypothetical protein n=1 Tax=Paraburkholderia mimosarum TaxID=312026 RepID=UPI0039C3AEF0
MLSTPPRFSVAGMVHLVDVKFQGRSAFRLTANRASAIAIRGSEASSPSALIAVVKLAWS